MSRSNAIPNPITLKGLDLSHMPKVEIQEAPGKRSYGRRFVVIIDGKASDEMVLKKILKQINKLSKIDKNLTPEEKVTQAKSIADLLGKLKKANQSANNHYEKRGRMYKFRTWFHRLGNWGTHEKNIGKLEHKLEKSFKTPLILNNKPIDTFIENNLPVFQASLRQGHIQLRIDKHDVKIGKDKISICKNDQEFVIKFNEGKVSEISFTKPQVQVLDVIPDQYVSILKKAFESAIIDALHWGYGINVVQSALSEFPVWHLKQLVEKLLQENLDPDYQIENDLKSNVTFYNDDIKPQAGFDAGGLKRAYVSTLAESVQNVNSLFLEGKDGLKCPRIERVYSPSAVLNCTPEEGEIYYNLGMLLRCSYNSDSITTGVCLSDILFNAALNFEYSELKSPFEDLSRKTHIRVARAIVQELLTNSDSQEKVNMLIALDLCDPAKLDLCLAQDDAKAMLKQLSIAAFVGMDDEGMETYLDEDLMNANIDAIKEDRKGFIDQLYQSIFSSKTFITQLNGASLGQMLSPSHSIARGMAINDKVSWNQIQVEGHQKLSLQTQGNLDKQVIVNALPRFAFDRDAELNWLKEWILSEETSNQDIKNFLAFVSGATSLSKHQKIIVKNSYSPLPVGHTCYHQIDLPQAASKEIFIENLKEAIVVTDFGMM